jgi:hypothetical protein
VIAGCGACGAGGGFATYMVTTSVITNCSIDCGIPPFLEQVCCTQTLVFFSCP